ncbi:uncharacterized protein DFL_009344 [Arthrobotrys flagrans]|uniref:Uncharacterized protein n=1 Tax=Arthrobotrys flagrans TaxID=97331 RepID=A0A436ZRB9_ARTFL|nr:hypothetical protein DFL_009344 [Arthrobotrys flagrans]
MPLLHRKSTETPLKGTKGSEATDLDFTLKATRGQEHLDIDGNIQFVYWENPQCSINDNDSPTEVIRDKKRRFAATDPLSKFDFKALRERHILPPSFNIDGIENAIALCKRYHALDTPVPMLVLVPLNLQSFLKFETNDFQQRLQKPPSSYSSGCRIKPAKLYL